MLRRCCCCCCWWCWWYGYSGNSYTMTLPLLDLVQSLTSFTHDVLQWLRWSLVPHSQQAAALMDVVMVCEASSEDCCCLLLFLSSVGSATSSSNASFYGVQWFSVRPILVNELNLALILLMMLVSRRAPETTFALLRRWWIWNWNSVLNGSR